MDDTKEPTMTVLRTAVAPPSRAALDRDERLVKDGILRMGSHVEQQIRDAIRAVVERDAATWVALATGARSWADARQSGTVHASGQRADLEGLLPVV